MRISHINKPHIIITMGDPAGIGPEVLVRALDRLNNFENVCTVIVGDLNLLNKLSAGLALPKILVHSLAEDLVFDQKAINMIDPGPEIGQIVPGSPTLDSTTKSLNFIDIAIDIIKDLSDDIPKALITAPVNKENIAGICKGFIGHTEYLQTAFSRKHVTMAMVGKIFTAIPTTRHIPVKEIANILTADLLYDTIHDVSQNLSILSDKDDPTICVCALNPHSGEGGKIGDEEIKILTPAIQKAKSLCKNLIGPISSDVAFYKAYKGDIDVVIGMYHDQCLAPFKMLEFDSGVNTTLGLGFVRTSPDHGTAYDIAGKNIANPESMLQAIELAIRSIGASSDESR